MRGKKASIAVGIMLSAALFLAAEVALDEVVQAGRFVLYRDHADAHKYYYVPDAPRLAMKRDGTPEFTFIKYAKTDGETKGGIVHFLVTWGMTEGELSSAESALRLKDPEAKIAGPVPFKEGTFKVVSATAGEGGIFSRRIVGEGKAPIMPGQKAAVSIALTEEGASLLWESFKNPTSDISVMFDLKFTGVSPAFQAKLKVNWDKVYTQHDIKLHAEGQIKVVKIEADVRAILEELRQKGAIELEVVGENENMQKMLDTVYAHLLALMCEKVPMGSGEAASPPAKKRPVPAVVSGFPGAHPVWSMGVLADVVRSADERLRGGPSWDQEQVSRQAAAPCDEQSRQRAEMLARRAQAFIGERKFTDAVSYYERAYEACPDAKYLYEKAVIQEEQMGFLGSATESYRKYIERAEALGSGDPLMEQARRRLDSLLEAQSLFDRGSQRFESEQFAEAAEDFERSYEICRHPRLLFNLSSALVRLWEISGQRDLYDRALENLKRALEIEQSRPDDIMDKRLVTTYRGRIEELRAALASRGEAARPQQNAEQAQIAAPARPTAGQSQSTGAAGGQTQQQATSQPGTKPPSSQIPPVKPPAQAPGTKPGAKPDAKAEPAVKPIVSVQVGYSFKRVKMSGNYQVDMRKRLREDRDIVMSGNIGGIYQKYGEDKRFFTVVSLDDPTFQERSVEVILDGQDASDFKNYINSVSVLFRKQRFSGAPMTGEVKFFDQQFAQGGNRLSFKYGRLNEASTEWLDYEYKPKWSFYGGVEWEGDWTKTSDSVLTLAPPVRRRTLEISVDEDNILKNAVKALALQIKHQIYGKDILKEVIINYDKGDPLQAVYTYMHEDGNLGYSYKVVWLLLDGREVHTDWMTKESPFIYAVYTKK